MPAEFDHHEAQGLLGAYALDAVPADETLALERHLLQCSECREELTEHRQVAGLLAASDRFAPAQVWDSIAGEISPQPSPQSVARLHRRRWMAPMAVAAAFVLVAGAAVVQSVRIGSITDDLENERQAVAALTDQLERPLDVAAAAALTDPTVQRVTLGSVSGANAVIVLMADGTGFLAEHTLQPLAAERTYQLWAIVGGKVISAGVLGPSPGVVAFRIDAEGFEGFAITEEVVGGVESSENDAVVAWLAA